MNRYESIRQEIFNRITRGEYQQGDLLPSENVLAKEFSVTRVTIRRALSDLEEERYITVRQGLGRVVNNRSNKIVSSLTKLESTELMISAAGYHPVEIRRIYEEVELSRQEAEVLGVSEEYSGKRLIRVRAIEKTAVSVSVNIFPKAYAPLGTLTGSLLSNLDENGIHIDYAETEIIVPYPRDPYVHLLTQDKEFMPIVVLQQVHFDWKHTPIFLAYDYLNTNVFSLTVTRKKQ